MKWANLDENGTCPYHVELRKKCKGNVEYECSTCGTNIGDSQNAVLCECCNTWFHAVCENIEDDTYKVLFEQGSKLNRLKFFCTGCDNKVMEALEKYKSLETDTKTLKQEMHTVQSDIAEIKTLCKTAAKKEVNQIMDDTKEIERRKMNLVVFGLAEPDPPSDDNTEWDNNEKIAVDTEVMNNIIVDDLGVPLSPRTGIIEVRRLGLKKPGTSRPLKVVFANLQTKREVLRNAKKLRSSDSEALRKVFINPDLTVKQKEADKVLREEMWERRSNGEHVIIHRNKIVTSTHPVRLHRSQNNKQAQNIAKTNNTVQNTTKITPNTSDKSENSVETVQNKTNEIAKAQNMANKDPVVQDKTD